MRVIANIMWHYADVLWSKVGQTNENFLFAFHEARAFLIRRPFLVKVKLCWKLGRSQKCRSAHNWAKTGNVYGFNETIAPTPNLPTSIAIQQLFEEKRRWVEQKLVVSFFLFSTWEKITAQVELRNGFPPENLHPQKHAFHKFLEVLQQITGRLAGDILLSDIFNTSQVSFHQILKFWHLIRRDHLFLSSQRKGFQEISGGMEIGMLNVKTSASGIN